MADAKKKSEQRIIASGREAPARSRLGTVEKASELLDREDKVVVQVDTYRFFWRPPCDVRS